MKEKDYESESESDIFHPSFQEYESLDEAFLQNAGYIERYGIESSPRGKKIKEIIFCNFKINDPRKRIVTIQKRKFSIGYLAAELIWYFSASNKADWIEQHASMWKSIKNKDNTVNSAYGNIIFSKDNTTGLSQWERVKNELKNDPNSRRAIININQGHKDYGDLDIPCTLNLQFLLRNKKLHLICQMRSNDLIFGTCNDIPFFTLLQELMSLELGVELGHYFHNANSLHVYEKHFEMIQDLESYYENFYRWIDKNKHPKNKKIESIGFEDTIQMNEYCNKIINIVPQFKERVKQLYYLSFDDEPDSTNKNSVEKNRKFITDLLSDFDLNLDTKIGLNKTQDYSFKSFLTDLFLIILTKEIDKILKSHETLNIDNFTLETKSKITNIDHIVKFAEILKEHNSLCEYNLKQLKNILFNSIVDNHFQNLC
jgi:thymidylate synthase